MEIIVKCQGAELVNHKDLVPFQGKLKVLDDFNYKKLKKEILEVGFSDPISVWVDGGKKKILNGHQRLATLFRLEKDGYEIPKIPINIVEAKSKLEAKRKLLALASQYGQVDIDGLKDFINGTPLDTAKLFESFRFPEIDEGEFVDKFYKEEDEERDSKEDDIPSDPDSVDTSIQLGDVYLLGAYYQCDNCDKVYDYEEGKKLEECACG